MQTSFNLKRTRLHRVLFVSAVAVFSAGGKGVFVHEIGRAAGFAHRVIKTAERRREVKKPELFCESADSAF